jgi:Na+/phosphate symporter
MLFRQIGDMSDFDRRWHLILMTYSTELETVGDIIEKNLSATMLRQLSTGKPPSH